MNLTVIKQDLTFYGIINIILYMLGSFILLPLLHYYFKINISLFSPPMLEANFDSEISTPEPPPIKLKFWAPTVTFIS